MREPSDIAVSGREFYVCDFKGHNVVVFSEEGQFVRRIGGENITNFPNGIDISGTEETFLTIVLNVCLQMLVTSSSGTLTATSSTWWCSPMTAASWGSSSVLMSR